MELSYLIVLIAIIFTGYCFYTKGHLREGMSGYGIMSGLAMNNDAKVCFKNIHDPPSFPGYCSVIGKVVV